MTALADGRYELGDVVGTGGMAQVRRATDTVLGRDVAVKVFREDLDDDSAARARTEMQTLAGLTHPNLVAVHDAGTSASGQPYLVMELVEGPSLAACCLDGSLTLELVADIGAGLADALAYVHSRGVVHRDVKPANVLLAPNGAKLADFGIARIVDGVRHTGTGLTVGTAPYLSPEQVTGEPVGPAADIYALGLVLLECLTGRREYTGGAVETALARLHRQPDIPTDLPEPWPGLLQAMTSRNASDRPSADEVAQVLRGGLAAGSGAMQPDAPTQVFAAATGPATAAVDPPTRVLDTPPRVVRPQAQDAADLRPVGGHGSWSPRLVLATWIVGAIVLIALFAAAWTSGQPSLGQPTGGTSVDRHIAELQDAVKR